MKSNKKRQKIYSALFDVRPVDNQGRLDLNRIKKTQKVLDLRGSKSYDKTYLKQDPKKAIKDRKPKKNLNQSDQFFKAPRFHQVFQKKYLSENKELEIKEASFKKDENYFSEAGLPTREELLKELEEIDESDTHLSLKNKGGKRSFSSSLASSSSKVPLTSKNFSEAYDFSFKYPEKKKSISKPRKKKQKKQNLLEVKEVNYYYPKVKNHEIKEKKFQKVFSNRKQAKDKKKNDFVFKKKIKSLAPFLIFATFVALIVPGFVLISHGFEIKQKIWNNSSSAYGSLLSAVGALKETDFKTARKNFEKAHFGFSEANNQIGEAGKMGLDVLEKLSLASSVSSGSHLISMGENLAEAGENIALASKAFSFEKVFNSLSLDKNKKSINNERSLTGAILIADKYLKRAFGNIKKANRELKQVKINSLPENIRDQVGELKNKLSKTEEVLTGATGYSQAFLKILGHYNPKQYLLVFQNNSEMRATGGFFGTYGLLKIDRGSIDRLKIEGVYEVDGQLHEKVIPPKPIQKISTAWSMHDANWFADFPTSADKISWFYEKTGGPTVDGVITLTPTVIERLLALTGPIEMAEYGITLNSSNFVKLIQYEVEEDYDRKLNQPKKVLADFTPKFIEKIKELNSQKKIEALNIILKSLNEKHILFYFQDKELQGLAKEKGWVGRLRDTEGDYFSVVSSNINGYKTDRVIEETINHKAEIQEDGSIIDTLTVIRKHNGGNKNYDWWNKVNANYLRVYLPEGTELISVSGQTKEFHHPPINYKEHGFKEDPLVGKIENKMKLDTETNTRIFKENNKTVFANWVYVSPNEEVKLVYKYKLPFKIDLSKGADNYSLLAQKQAGSLGSDFSHSLDYPDDWEVSWLHPSDLKVENGKINYGDKLNIDRFLGITFSF